MLDYNDLHGVSSHLWGVVELGAGSYIVSDWREQNVLRVSGSESEVLMGDLYRPSQIHLQKPFQHMGEKPFRLTGF